MGCQTFGQTLSDGTDGAQLYQHLNLQTEEADDLPLFMGEPHPVSLKALTEQKGWPLPPEEGNSTSSLHIWLPGLELTDPPLDPAPTPFLGLQLGSIVGLDCQSPKLRKQVHYKQSLSTDTEMEIKTEIYPGAVSYWLCFSEEHRLTHQKARVIKAYQGHAERSRTRGSHWLERWGNPSI